MKKMKITIHGTAHKLLAQVERYATNGNLGIILLEDVQGYYEDFAIITVNTSTPMFADNFSAVDTNNFPWAEKLIERYELGKYAGYEVASGVCRYPVYEFDMDKLNEYAV